MVRKETVSPVLATLSACLRASVVAALPAAVPAWLAVVLCVGGCSLDAISGATPNGDRSDVSELREDGVCMIGDGAFDNRTCGDVSPVMDGVQPFDYRSHADAMDRTGDLDVAESAEPPHVTPGGLPLALPFVFERKQQGTPVSDEEVAQFTARLTGLWKDVDYYMWVQETCHGMDETSGWPDYLIWWHDIDAVKTGDLVTFRHNSQHGGSHNNAEPTGMVLSHAMTGYLLTGDEDMAAVTEGFTKSHTALMKGFLFDEDDPLQYILSRNIVTHNHDYTLPNGKKKAVDYTDWYFTYQGWNADRVHFPNNPYWGDIYVTTMRSKDDVHYIYRVYAWLPYLIELAPEGSEVRAAAEEAKTYIEGFAKDIVDSGYVIRSKDADGKPFVPDQDLASFAAYTGLFPDAECDPRLATALVAYGDTLDNDCGDGQGSLYDTIAGGGNYFNYAIIDGFHMNAVHLSLVQRHDELALQLLEGLAKRIERYQDPAADEPGEDDPSWDRDIASLLLQSAVVGLPLTWDEARKVQKYFDGSVERFSKFPNWDLWDPSVPDGTYDFREGFHPKNAPDAIRVEELTMFLEYCWSPFRNPAGATVVDCGIVSNPALWGTIAE